MKLSIYTSKKMKILWASMTLVSWKLNQALNNHSTNQYLQLQVILWPIFRVGFFLWSGYAQPEIKERQRSLRWNMLEFVFSVPRVSAGSIHLFISEWVTKPNLQGKRDETRSLYRIYVLYQGNPLSWTDWLACLQSVCADRGGTSRYIPRNALEGASSAALHESNLWIFKLWQMHRATVVNKLTGIMAID